jgi:hypothetical protein
VQVAETALAATRDLRACAVVVEVGDDFAARQIGDRRADGHPQFPIFTAASVAIGTATIGATVGLEYPRIAKIDQGVQVAVGDRPDAAAATTVAAIRAAERNEFLAPERGRAISAVAGDDFYLRFVKKLHFAPYLP